MQVTYGPSTFKMIHIFDYPAMDGHKGMMCATERVCQYTTRTLIQLAHFMNATMGRISA